MSNVIKADSLIGATLLTVNNIDSNNNIYTTYSGGIGSALNIIETYNIITNGLNVELPDVSEIENIDKLNNEIVISNLNII